LIEAENFTDYRDNDRANRGGAFRDTGVDIQSCGDTGCGHNIGWMATGEWLEYEIDVAETGNYQASVRLATRQRDTDFSIDIDGSNVTGSVGVRNTRNWQNWYTEVVDLGVLSAGEHTLRFNVDDGFFNLNWINITETGGSDRNSDNEARTAQ